MVREAFKILPKNQFRYPLKCLYLVYIILFLYKIDGKSKNTLKGKYQKEEACTWEN